MAFTYVWEPPTCISECRQRKRMRRHFQIHQFAQRIIPANIVHSMPTNPNSAQCPKFPRRLSWCCSLAFFRGRIFMDGGPPFVCGMMAPSPNSLVLSCLIEGRSLGNAIVMALPHYVRIRREGKKAFDGLSARLLVYRSCMEGFRIPNLDVSSTINPSPDTQDVLATPDTQHGAAYFITGLHELISNNSEQEVLPVPVSHPLFQPHNPFAPALVRFVLPDRPDALLEDVVVRDRR